MKKPFVSMLAAALVLGAAGTAFAANPFSDVPANHWAYDAVSQLAADGVIDGYGDGAYRGSQEITRYEMAQMIARAMAKENNAAAKAQLDKLAAEFADELNSLGVRVANLEKKTDNVRWFGELRYTGQRLDIKDKDTGKKRHYEGNDAQLRLKADATVNKHWTAKAGFYYNFKNNTDAYDSFSVDYLYAQGQYGDTTINLGQYSAWDTVTEGMLWDTHVTGFLVKTGKKLQVTAQAARVNEKRFIYNGTTHYFDIDSPLYPLADLGADYGSSTADMLGLTVDYKTDKVYLGAGYYNFRGSVAYKTLTGDDAHIWAVGAAYRFDKNWRLYATYAANAGAKKSVMRANNIDTGEARAFNIELDYKSFDLAKPGSCGYHIAYKHLGDMTVSNGLTYEMAGPEIKGFEVEADWVLAKNVLLNLGYFNGERITGRDDAQLFTPASISSTKNLSRL